MSFSSKLRLLLDTTYILPVLGVEVAGVERALETLCARAHIPPFILASERPR